MLEVFQALSDARRLEILRLLGDEELAAGEIAAQFDLKRPTISHHLAVLEGAGLVRVRREGTRRLYAIRPEQFESVQEYLAAFWGDRLLDLKSRAEADHRREDR